VRLRQIEILDPVECGGRSPETSPSKTPRVDPLVVSATQRRAPHHEVEDRFDVDPSTHDAPVTSRIKIS
jgi:hypothetical protein